MCVEIGLVEEAKHFRGINHEPRPNWNPLVLSAADHYEMTSKKIDLSYQSLNEVQVELIFFLPLLLVLII